MAIKECLFILCTVLICFAVTIDASAPEPNSSELDDLHSSGERALKLLKQWYHNSVDDCGSDFRPSYLCSGIWTRVTTTDLDYLPWQPSPRAIAKGGLSLAWLRQDQTFTNILVDDRNGLIFYPNDHRPADTVPLDVLCTFPRDSNTWSRDTLNGCGPSSKNPDITKPCTEIGVFTAKQWIQRYGNIRSSCAWSLRPEAGRISHWFSESTKAHQTGPRTTWEINNELIVRTWVPGTNASLPLLAFFYFRQTALELEARNKAWVDQWRFYREYRMALPIISIDLPAARDLPVVIEYLPTDQGLDWNRTRLEADFEDVELGSHTRFFSGGIELMMSGPTSQITNETLIGIDVSTRYARTNGAIGFGVKGDGLWTIRFDWACNNGCVVTQSMAKKSTELSSGRSNVAWSTGIFATIVSGPEHVSFSRFEERYGWIIMDNLTIAPYDEIGQAREDL